MAKFNSINELFKGICDAIREKKGTVDLISHQDIPSEILSIEVGTGGGDGGMEVTNKYVRMLEYKDVSIFDDFEEDCEKYIIDAYRMFNGNPSLLPQNSYQKLSNKPIKFYSLYQAFYGNTNFNTNSNPVDISSWDVSRVYDMYQAFAGCTGMQNVDLIKWDVSNVLDFSNMFGSCGNITELDLSSWDVSNARTLSGIFSGCSKLSKINMNNWNTSKAKSISSMFNGCYALEELDLSHLNLDECTDVSSLVSGCRSLKKLRLPNVPRANMASLLGTSNNHILYDFQFTDGGTFCSELTTSSSSSLNLTRIWKQSQEIFPNGATNNYGFYYEEFAKSIGPNTTGLTRTVKLNTNLYNSLTDEQKALLVDKGYTITYGTS